MQETPDWQYRDLENGAATIFPGSRILRKKLEAELVAILAQCLHAEVFCDF